MCSEFRCFIPPSPRWYDTIRYWISLSFCLLSQIPNHTLSLWPFSCPWNPPSVAVIISYDMVRDNLSKQISTLCFFPFLLRVLDLWEEWRRHSGPCLFQKMRNLPLIWWWEMSTMHRSRSILPITPLSVGLSGIYSLFCFFLFQIHHFHLKSDELSSCYCLLTFGILLSPIHPIC